jgi:hypothetical protein
VQNLDKSMNSHSPKIVPKSIWDQSAKLVPQSHKSLDCGSGTNRDCETGENADPLAMPGVTRLLLSERASAVLLEAGECFTIVGKGSYPDQPGRMAVYLQAVPMATAAAACGVIAGTHTARRIKPERAASKPPRIECANVP